jgi:hypothetical protein
MGFYEGRIFFEVKLQETRSSEVVGLGSGFIAKALYVWSPYAWSTYEPDFEEMARKSSEQKRRFRFFGVYSIRMYSDGTVTIQKTEKDRPIKVVFDTDIMGYILKFILLSHEPLKISAS